MRLPSGATATERTWPAWFVNNCRFCHVSASQIRTVPSLLPEASALPLGKYPTDVTPSEGPRSTRSSSSVAALQILMLPSALPETIRVPSGDAVTDHIAGGTSHE